MRRLSSSAAWLISAMVGKIRLSKNITLFCARRFHGVSAKFVAHHGEELIGEWLWVLRAETHVQRTGNHRHRNAQLYALDHGPATFARIGDVPFNSTECGILRERVHSEIEQPGTNHAAKLPDFAHLQKIQRKFLLVAQQVQPFRICLHDSVLNSVVNHLHKMPRPGRSYATPALIRTGRQRLKNRREALHHVRIAPYHHAIAFRDSPDAATRAAIHEIYFLWRHR